eukprot:scaffold6.g2787.t1
MAAAKAPGPVAANRSIHASSCGGPALRAGGGDAALPLRTGRPRLVVLGSGWGAARLVRDIDPSKWDITVVSPRNHMASGRRPCRVSGTVPRPCLVFTPLLAATCVGGLETRAVTVPITDMQPALKQPQARRRGVALRGTACAALARRSPRGPARAALARRSPLPPCLTSAFLHTRASLHCRLSRRGNLSAPSPSVPAAPSPSLRPAALLRPQNFFFGAECRAVHPADRTVECASDDGMRFFCEYDALAIATGSQGSTFGIPGVELHAHFLRQAADSVAIRNKLIANWTRANIPGRSQARAPCSSARPPAACQPCPPRCAVDNWAYNPTRPVSAAGARAVAARRGDELSSFVNRDLRRADPQRARDMRITVVEAKEIMGSFDAALREHTARRLIKQGVHLVKGVVREVRETELELHGAIGAIPFGLCIWSTGVGPTRFTLGLPFARTPCGRVAVDGQLRVLAPPEMDERGHVRVPEDHGTGPKELADVSIVQDEEVAELGVLGEPLYNVFALGDCCANPEQPLPALAAVAEQQGQYLAAYLNEAAGDWDLPEQPPFQFRTLASRASAGGRAELLDPGGGGRHLLLSWAGFASWVAWRSAYLTRLGRWKHRLFVASNWTLTKLFGRDTSRW